MAQVKGEFLADFASFYEAVQKAEVSLDGLETNASKVEKALDRATNAFSGTKLIQDATIAMEAVKALGGGVDALAGVTKLTAAEQAKLNAQLTEAIAKYSALGKEAPADMVALQKATTATVEATGKLAKGVAEAAPKDGGKSWVSDFTGQVTSMAAGMVSAQAIISGFQAAWGKLTEFVGSSVAEFAEAEAVNKKLAISLEGINQATPRASAYMADLAAAFSSTTKYSGDLITEMEALLIQVGQVLPADMKGALSAATDLASGLGIDLESATTALAKAFAGNSDALKKFGLDISDARLKAEGMPYVLDEINKRFGGQAQGEMDTYAGKVEALGNKWDDVKEKVGQVIVQSPFLAAALQAMEDGFGGAGDAADDYSAAISNALEKGGFKGYADAARYLEGLATQYTETAWARKQFEEAPVSENESIRLGNAQDHARSLATVTEELKKADQATKDKKKADADAASEAKRHADEIANLTKKLTGDGAIEQAQKYVLALKDVEELSKLSTTAQKEIAEAVWKGIEAFKAAGKDIPPEMAKVWGAVAKPPDIKIESGIDSLAGALKNTEVPIAKLNSGITKMFADADESAAKYQAEMDGLVQTYIDMQYKSKEAGDIGKGALDGVADSAERATVAMQDFGNTAMSAYERAIAGAQLFKAYQDAGIATSGQIAMGGYNFKQLQETGVPGGLSSTMWANANPNTGGQWGNTLNVNVNNADAQGIASKLVNEMRHSGYRF